MKNSKGRKKKKKKVKRGGKKKKVMFPPGIEPGTLRVWGARDNRYTTETTWTKVPHNETVDVWQTFFTNDLLVVMVSVLLVMVSVSVLQLKKGFSLKRSILSDINYIQ